MDRLLHSFFAVVYLLLITKWIQMGFEIPLLFAAMIVGLVSCVLMAILAAISVRFSKTREHERRFQLSTALLVVCYLSIHLAITRHVLQRATDDRQLEVEGFVISSVLGLINVFVSTFLLLGLMEAIVAYLNRILRWLAVRKRR